MPVPTGEMSVGAQALAVLVQPPPEPRPLTDERFVGELHGAFVHRHQPRPNQLVEEVVHHRCGFRARSQLPQGHPTTRVLRPLAGLGQPEERPPQEVLLGLGGVREELLGGLGDGTPYTSGIPVPVEGKSPSVPPGPRLHERMREQRQSAGLPGRIPKDELDQAGLAPKPLRLRRLLDGSLYLALGHRAEQHVARGHVVGELLVHRAVAVEVRSQRDERLSTAAYELVEEPRAT